MNGLKDLWDLFLDSLRVFGEKFTETIPSLLIAIIVILIAWLMARLISGGFEWVLKTVKFDRFAEKIKMTSFFEQAGIQVTPSAIIGRFIYWVFVLLIIASAAETLHWTAISSQIQRFWEYLPNLITAILVFIVGSYLTSLVRDFVRSSASSLGKNTQQ